MPNCPTPPIRRQICPHYCPQPEFWPQKRTFSASTTELCRQICTFISLHFCCTYDRVFISLEANFCLNSRQFGKNWRKGCQEARNITPGGTNGKGRTQGPAPRHQRQRCRSRPDPLEGERWRILAADKIHRRRRGRRCGHFLSAAGARTLYKFPPAGYTAVWSGQFEQQQEDMERLEIPLPATLVIIMLPLYFAARSIFRVVVVMLAVPFSLVAA